MTYEQLQTFIAVASVGSFRAAADQLHVSQPTVSSRIQALEERLNRQVFERSRQGVTLTAAGATFLGYAVTAVQAIAQGREEAKLDKRFSGSVSLGVQLYFWEEIVEPWLALMTDLDPTLALRVEPDYSASIMDQLVSGLLDVGIVFEPRLTTGIVVEPMTEEQLWLVTTNPDAGSSSWSESFVSVYWGREFLDAFSLAFPVQPQPRLSFGLPSIGLRHLLSHGGAAVLAARSVERLIEDGRLYRVPDAPVFRRPTFLVYRNLSGDDRRIKSAIECLRLVMNGTRERKG